MNFTETKQYFTTKVKWMKLMQFCYNLDTKLMQRDNKTKEQEFKVMDMLFNLCRERYQQKDV